MSEEEVGQVFGFMRREGGEGESCQLKVDALLHREPV